MVPQKAATCCLLRRQNRAVFFELQGDISILKSKLYYTLFSYIASDRPSYLASVNRVSTMSHGAAETERLKANIQDQLSRLLVQLK